MKIQTLELKKFGPFNGTVLDFSQAGLQIVFGPNESGKSSSLRALRQLLYGIPSKSADDFNCAAKDLRLGACLMHSDGSSLKVTRRKGKTQSLRDELDNDVLDGSVLHKYLGNISPAQFESMFGIDHAGLIAGGKALFDGKGDLGQILFAAGAGVGDVNRIEDNLSATADALFRPQGSTQIINSNLAQLKEAQGRLKKSEVPATEWENLDRSLQKSRAKKKQVEQEINQKQQLLGKLQRIKDALPLVAQRLELQKLLQVLKEAETILLPENFGDRSRELQLDLKRLGAEQENLEKALDALDAELVTMNVPTGLIDRAIVIEDLQQKLGSHLKAVSDRSANVVVGLTQHENAMKAALKNLGHPPELDFCDKLRITVAEKALIRELAENKTAVEGHCEIAKTRMELLKTNIAATEAALSRLADVVEPELMIKAVKRIEQKGAIETQLKLAKTRSDSAAEQLAVSVRKLMISNSPALTAIFNDKNWEELESLVVPGPETIDRFHSDIDRCSRELETLQTNDREIADELQRLSQHLEQLRLEMDTPTEDNLSAARANREHGWQLVKGAWKQLIDEPAEIADFIALNRAIGAPVDDLAEAYEQTVSRADNISDRLRRESTQIAKRAAMMAEQAKHNQKRIEISERIAKCEDQQKFLEDEWVAAWSQAEIKPLPPKEMRAWSVGYLDAVKQVKTVREALVNLHDLESQVAESQLELASLLEEPGQPLKLEPLPVLLERCQEIIAANKAVQIERANLKRDLDRQILDQSKAEQEFRASMSSLDGWRTKWAGAVKPLRLEGSVLPSQANAIIETLDTLFANQTQAQQFANRLNGIDRDAANFKARVSEIVSAVAPDLLDFPPEQAAVELNSRLAKARTNKERLELLSKQREEKAALLEAGQLKLQQCKSELDLMCQLARCKDYESLAAAAESSKALSDAQSSMAQVEKALMALSGGAGVDEFIVTVADVDADNIAPKMSQLEAEVEELSQARTEHDQAIGRDQAELDRIDGSGLAAEAAEDIQSLMAKIGTASEQYARAHIAKELLKQCVARYRDKNQSPVLKRASEFFEGLTLGSFIALREDYGDKGESILVGVRPDKTLVGLPGMSDGTCDQAYLSLRLASLEQYLGSFEPLPFIVDDILVNFDDARSQAALTILSALAKRTQVIFFTHNAHLVQLATKVIKPEDLFVQELTKAQQALPVQ